MISYVKKKPEQKYEYRINTNIMVGIFKEELINIFLRAEEEIQENYDKMILKINQYLVPIKPNRNFEKKRGIV